MNEGEGEKEGWGERRRGGEVERGGRGGEGGEEERGGGTVPSCGFYFLICLTYSNIFNNIACLIKSRITSPVYHSSMESLCGEETNRYSRKTFEMIL